MRKNMKIRKALLEAGMTQLELGKILGISQPTLSLALSRFELSANETNRLIRIIKEGKAVEEE